VNLASRRMISASGSAPRMISLSGSFPRSPPHPDAADRNPEAAHSFFLLTAPSSLERCLIAGPNAHQDRCVHPLSCLQAPGSHQLFPVLHPLYPTLRITTSHAAPLPADEGGRARARELTGRSGSCPRVREHLERDRRRPGRVERAVRGAALVERDSPGRPRVPPRPRRGPPRRRVRNGGGGGGRCCGRCRRCGRCRPSSRLDVALTSSGRCQR